MNGELIDRRRRLIPNFANEYALLYCVLDGEAQCTLNTGKTLYQWLNGVEQLGAGKYNCTFLLQHPYVGSNWLLIKKLPETDTRRSALVAGFISLAESKLSGREFRSALVSLCLKHGIRYEETEKTFSVETLAEYNRPDWAYAAEYNKEDGTAAWIGFCYGVKISDKAGNEGVFAAGDEDIIYYDLSGVRWGYQLSAGLADAISANPKCPSWVKYIAADADGCLHGYSVQPKASHSANQFCHCLDTRVEQRFCDLGYCLGSSDWSTEVYTRGDRSRKVGCQEYTMEELTKLVGHDFKLVKSDD